MSDAIVAVLCDHQCTSHGPLQAASLTKRLAASPTIGKLIVLDKACHDPELLAIAAKAQKPIEYVSPEEAQAYTRSLLELTPDVVEQIKKAHGIQ